MALWEKVLKNKKLPANLSEKLTSNLNTLRRATEPDNILFHMVDYEQTYKQFYHSLHEHEHRLSSICSKTKMDNILSNMSMVANIYPHHKTITHKNNPILLLEDSFILEGNNAIYGTLKNISNVHSHLQSNQEEIDNIYLMLYILQIPTHIWHSQSRTIASGDQRVILSEVIG